MTKSGASNGKRSQIEGLVGKGERNEHLFRHLLKQAPHCDTIDDLFDVAQKLNEFEFEEELPETEVEKTVYSAWQYETEGNNWVGQGSKSVFTSDEMDTLAPFRKGGDALMLLGKLRVSHAKRNEPFAVATTAMTRSNVLPGWTEYRYRKARDILVEARFLVEVRVGQRRSDGKHEPNLYRFS